MKSSRSEAIKELEELIEIPLIHPELYDDIGIPPPRAVLLYGITGVGKTFLIKKASNRANARLVTLNLETITRNGLLKIVENELQKTKPIVFYLVMHNPDMIDQDIISTLAKILDGDLDLDLNHVVFAGSTVRPSLPFVLTRPGRFDRELYISLPDERERFEILEEIVRDTKVSQEVNLIEIAKNCRGYTPADLVQLMKTAARIAIRRKFSDVKTSEKTEEIPIQIDLTDFNKAIDEIKPTVYKELGFTKPNVPWDELTGHTEIKNSIEEKVIEPLKYSDFFKNAEVSTIKGILLYGPPGNGKTTLAKAITTALDAHFIYINASEFKDSSKSNLELAQVFNAADEVAPAVIFIDEADSLLAKREEVKEESLILVNEFLTLIDGRSQVSRTLVIAATNFIDKIDEAVKRPGRLEMQLFVSPPSDDERRDVFRYLTKTKKLSNNLDFDHLSKLTKPKDNKYFSFADLTAIVREAGTRAAQEAIKRNRQPEDVHFDNHHFEQVIEQYTPSIPLETLLLEVNSGDKLHEIKSLITPEVIYSFVDSMNNEEKIELYNYLRKIIN